MLLKASQVWARIQVTLTGKGRFLIIVVEYIALVFALFLSCSPLVDSPAQEARQQHDNHAENNNPNHANFVWSRSRSRRSWLDEGVGANRQHLVSDVALSEAALNLDVQLGSLCLLRASGLIVLVLENSEELLEKQASEYHVRRGHIIAAELADKDLALVAVCDGEGS